MSFASPIFLWLFMPAVLLALWLLPKRARNVVVSAASLLFYAWGAGSFVGMLVACILVNFAAGRAMESPAAAPGMGRRKLILAGAVAFDLAVLVVWKYGSFGLEQGRVIADQLGADLGSVAQITLPIGISFFTFHHISYVVDVYRGVRPPQRSLLQFVTYIAMFPQLVAGPIVRYHEIADQLPADTPRDRLDDFSRGFPRFALGLAKKVMIADSIAPIADSVYGLHGGDLTTPVAWLGALAYAMQIYFDFSGYSDMAIGLGRMLGFKLPENFDRPYSAVSITDFWRRWHMSLSRWFRDYLYIPLGGNRGSAAATYRNLVIVFLLVGLWHGAAWTFVLWGTFHGAMLVAERVTGLRRLPDDTLQIPRRALTFLLVVIAWVPFRAGDLGQAGDMLRAMFAFDFGPAPLPISVATTHVATAALILALPVVLLPRSFVLGRYLDEGRSRLAVGARLAVVGAAAPIAAILVAAGTFSPFLYFQF